MQRWSYVFLVVLRLAIGWHFLVEGWQKVQSVYLVGETATNRPFSSAGYFREAPGPLGGVVRSLAGDPDQELLARLRVEPIPPSKDPATYEPYLRLPAGLSKDWKALIDAYRAHYGLDASQADAVYKQVGNNTVAWLTYVPPGDAAARARDANYEKYTTEQTRTFPSGDVKRRLSMAERIQEYEKKLGELADAQERNYAFGRDVAGANLRTLKGDVARLRSGLQSSLNEQTDDLRAALDKVLTAEQKAKGPLPKVKATGLIDYVDSVTPFALLGIGACLLLGLFTRLAAWSAVVFLLMTYLAVPSLPWYPTPPQSEGNYLLVNKNVIEMLALCVIGTTTTGRWFGVDAILYAFGVLLFKPGMRKSNQSKELR